MAEFVGTHIAKFWVNYALSERVVFLKELSHALYQFFDIDEEPGVLSGLGEVLFLPKFPRGLQQRARGSGVKVSHVPSAGRGR